MEIPQDILHEGVCRIYLDTPKELEEAVKEYNKKSKECKPKMKLARKIEDGFLILNPLAVIAIYATQLKTFFANPALAAALLTLCAVVYFVFGIIKRYLWAVVLVDVPLVLLSPLYIGILIAVDIGLVLWHDRIREPLKNRCGYPDFILIEIIYEKGQAPQIVEDRDRL